MEQNIGLEFIYPTYTTYLYPRHIQRPLLRHRGPLHGWYATTALSLISEIVAFVPESLATCIGVRLYENLLYHAKKITLLDVDKIPMSWSVHVTLWCCNKRTTRLSGWRHHGQTHCRCCLLPARHHLWWVRSCACFSRPTVQHIWHVTIMMDLINIFLFPFFSN